MFGSLFIPQWPLAAAYLAGVCDVSLPAVLLRAGHVEQMNIWAERVGVAVGMKASLARSLSEDLALVTRDARREEEYFSAVLAMLNRHIARVASVRAGLVLFPLAKRMDEEEAWKLSEDILGDLAESVGCEGHCGFGPIPFVALLAAQQDRYVRIDQADDFLGGQSIDVLRLASADLDEEIALLHSLGVHRIRQVRDLGHEALYSRWARKGSFLWDLVSEGRLPLEFDVFTPHALRISTDFEEGIGQEEAAIFHLKTVVESVCEQARAAGYVGGNVSVQAHFSHGDARSSSWLMEDLTAASLLERLRWHMRSWQQADTGELQRVDIVIDHGITSAAYRSSLWGQVGRKEPLVQRSVARIESFLGQGSVHSGGTRAGRIPARRNQETSYLTGLQGKDHAGGSSGGKKSSTPASSAESGAWRGAIPGIGRLHTTALPARMRTREGQEISVNAEGALIVEGAAYVSGAVVQEVRPAVLAVGERAWEISQWAGPWLIDEYWWDPSRHTRRAYMQVATEKSVHLLYREGGRWFEEGNYA